MTKSPNSEGDPSPTHGPASPRWHPGALTRPTALTRYVNSHSSTDFVTYATDRAPDTHTCSHSPTAPQPFTHSAPSAHQHMRLAMCSWTQGPTCPHTAALATRPRGRCSHVVTEAPERIALEQPHSCLMHPRPLHALEMSLPTTHRGPLQTQAVSFPLLFTSTPCSLHDTFSLPEILRLHIWVCIQCPFRRESRPRRRFRRTNSSHLPRSNTAFRTGYGRPQKTSVVQGVTPDPAGGHQQEPI